MTAWVSATIKIRSPGLAPKRARSCCWTSGEKNLAVGPVKVSGSTLSQIRPLAPMPPMYSVRPSRSLRL